jgi:hypothetical protein
VGSNRDHGEGQQRRDERHQGRNQVQQLIGVFGRNVLFEEQLETVGQWLQ